MRIALCDDSVQDRSALESMLQEYAGLHPGVAVAVFSSGRQLLGAGERSGFDVYVLDVMMPELSGIELGLRLREQGQRGEIVYLTCSPEFAVDSYKVGAFYYLLKPVDGERLFEVLDRALAEAKKEKAGCIAVKTRDGLQLVRRNEIIFAELAGRTARYHLADGGTIDSVTLRRAFRDEVEPLLGHAEFILCGASFAVNLHYVSKVEKAVLCLGGGERIPMSRSMAVQVRKRWRDYWLGPEKEVQE